MIMNIVGINRNEFQDAVFLNVWRVSWKCYLNNVSDFRFLRGDKTGPRVGLCLCLLGFGGFKMTHEFLGQKY